MGNGTVWESPAFPIHPDQGWSTDGTKPLHQIRESSRVTGDPNSPNATLLVHSVVKLMQATPGNVALLGSTNASIGWEINPLALAGEFVWNIMYATHATTRTDSNLIADIRLMGGGIPSYASGQGFEQANFFPAIYDKQFHLTCYIAVLEGDERFKKGAFAAAPGIAKGRLYNKKFLAEVRMNGSGLQTDGKYIHWLGQKFGPDTCARTKSGICAVDKQSAAVHPTVIPRQSTFSYRPDTSRWHAIDTGGGIDGYHIDLFFGFRRDDCMNFGVDHYSDVKLVYRQLLF